MTAQDLFNAFFNSGQSGRGVLATTVIVDSLLAPLIATGICDAWPLATAGGNVGKKTAEAAPPVSAAIPSGAVG